LCKNTWVRRYTANRNNKL